MSNSISLYCYKKPPVNNKAKVEARLEKLRHSDRLAIHTFEGKDDKTYYPKVTMGDLEHNAKAPLSQLLCDDDIALFSMTLLPHSKPILPYSVSDTAYLFDLSHSGKTPPPLVVRTFSTNGATSKDRYDKNLKLDGDDGAFCGIVDGLMEVYRGHTTESFKKEVAAHPELSTYQLDKLAAYYDLPDMRETPFWNEVVAAVTKDHIAAIAMPYHPERGKTAPGETNAEALVELKGAMAGIEHLKKGIDLPVVMYHVSDLAHPENAGKCTYIAQGEIECIKVAINAIRTLQEHKNPRLNDLSDDCFAVLGVNVAKPVDAQVTRSLG